MTVATGTRTKLHAIHELGQSIWMDNISRHALESGDLKRFIEEGVRGVTSNPTIFDKAISKSADYDDEIRRLVAAGADAGAIYQALTVADIRTALDLFRPLYDESQGTDGFVSLEVSPLLARDTAATIAEAKSLWSLLGRPNALIKIPGTPEGLPAIEECLYSGVNINITLLFSVQAYEKVAQAYIRALSRRAAEGLPIDRIASVASFFVSRIDTEVDKRIEARLKDENDPAKREALQGLLGKIAIANAKNAYTSFQRIFGSDEFRALKAKGARVQRVLWASTSTKNPSYPDTMYVTSLIGPDTVNTMPPETIEAVQDHGEIRAGLTDGMDEARKQVQRLGELGIDFNDVTDVLLEQGIKSFAASFEQLMNGIEAKRTKLLQEARA
jgi:transaldolase